MAKIVGDLERPPLDGPDPEEHADLADLAERMRGTVTPVVGYLELISQDRDGLSPERHREWIATIERRLDAVRETSDQISRICDVLTRSMDDREASTPRAPEAPAD
jgi:hypothetical protein